MIKVQSGKKTRCACVYAFFEIKKFILQAHYKYIAIFHTLIYLCNFFLSNKQICALKENHTIIIENYQKSF